MYSILIGDIHGNNKFIYYPADPKLCVYDTELEVSIGDCGTFTFKVPFDNINYQLLAEQKIITINRNDNEFWRGYIKEITTTINKSLEVYCVEDLNWLAYEYLPPVSEKVTKAQKLQEIVNYYNSLTGITGTEKAFEAGYVTTDIQRNYQTTYEESLLENLRTLAGDSNYVRVRRENGHRYIDIVTLEAFGTNSKQKIRLAENLLDYVKELTTSYMLNVIYPYGAEIEGEELYEGVSKRLVGTPIVNNESIAKYGRIAKNIFFDTADATALQQQAEEYLNRNINPRIALELTAVDMAELGANTDGLKVGDKVEVIAEPLGIDSLWIPITKQSIDLQKIDNNKLTLSSTVASKSFTAQYAEMSEEVSKIPSKQSLLESARINAMNLLDGGDGGYVTYKFNEDGQPVEIRITDALEESGSLKKWVWNENGLGYMTRESTTEEFKPSDVSVALTMDGQILARRGVIGSGNDAWSIGESSIYNGTSSMTDTTSKGSYIGIDGLLNVGEEPSTEIKPYVKIQNGRIEANSIITCGGVIGRATVQSATGFFDTLGVEETATIKKAITTDFSASKALIGNFVDANWNPIGYTGAFTAVSTYGSIRVLVRGGIITGVENL